MKTKHFLIVIFLISWIPAFCTLTTPSLVSPAIGSTNNSPDVLLDWSVSTGATGYEYKINTDPGLAGAIVQTVTGTSQANTLNLKFGTVYYWQVRAIKTSLPTDSSAWSAVWNLTTTDQLTLVSPTSGATNQSPDVILDWSPLTGITFYDYQWDTTATFSSPLNFYGSVAVGSSQITSANLRFGTKYYWRARARHTVDTTQWSAVWSFTTTDQLTLVSPTSGATNQSPDVILDWSPRTGITFYDYQWDTTATFSSPLNFYGSVAVGSSQITSANLRFGTKYYWRARARHTVDTTQWSAVWSFTTTDQLALVSPTSGATNQSPDVTLDWSPLTGITYYDYQWDTTATFSSPLNFYGSVAVGSSQIASANLRFGTKYYWRARARHTVDTTQWSSVWNFISTDQLTLVSPTNGATDQAPNVILDWSPLTGITYYDYQWDTTATFTSPLNFYGSVAVGSSQITSTNLRFGAKYYWRARARHTTDTTQWTPTWIFTTIEYLTHVSPADNATGVSLNPTIDWSSLGGITGYQYQYCTDINFTTPSLFTIGITSQANLISLSYGTQYYWQARAFHSADTSAWSIPWSFTTLYQLTTAPTLISPTNNAFNIPITGTTLVWSTVSGATLYEFQYADNSSFTNPVVNTTAGLNSLTGSLLADTLYYWKVRAGNGSGYSPWSVVWSFSTEIGIGVLEEREESEVSLYPNPTCGGIVNVRSKETELSNITVFNMQGKQTLYVQFKNQRDIEFDVSALANGIYLLKIQSKNGVVNKKLVIQK